VVHIATAMGVVRPVSPTLDAWRFPRWCSRLEALCAFSLGVFVSGLCGTRWVSFPVLSIPSRELLCGTGGLLPEKENV
jgi:hypothetical protein